MKKNKKKICIIHPEGNLNNNPNLSAICNILYDNNYKVDVWSLINPNNNFQLPPHCHAEQFLVQNFSEVEIIISDYYFVIGVDNGIVYAHRLSKILNIAYGFVSYEIMFDSEIIYRKDLQAKQNVKKACKDITFAIVQDELRASKLVEEYGINYDKIVTIPVAGDNIIQYNKSFYLHDLLSLPRNTKILLHIGSIEKWTLTDWAIKHVTSMPPGWVMVLHNKNGKTTGISENNRLFYTNLSSLSFVEMQPLIQSANCCLGLYTSVEGTLFTQKNIEYIGLSAGKISNSLQHGVPVLVNSIGEYSMLIEKYNAGKIIDIESKIPFADIDKFSDSQAFVQNCHQLFSEKLDIKNQMEKVIKTINSVINEARVNHTDFKGNDENLNIVYKFDQLTLKYKIRLLRKVFIMTLIHVFIKYKTRI